MNRFPSGVASWSTAQTETQGTDRVESGTFRLPAGNVPVSFFAPLHYEANYAYPLLVWLHGSGGDERQLKRIMPLVSLRNYVGLAVRGTVTQPNRRGTTGYSWSQSGADVALAEQRVFDAIELARERFHLHPRRVFLAGFDAGGSMAFRIAMTWPDRFAGVLSLEGPFPDGFGLFHRLLETRRLPVFYACGRTSAELPMERVCEHLKLFHAAGMQVAVRQYPCGHELDSLMLADMDRWMMEVVTGPRPSAAAR